jgi:hypothetical protein
LPEFHADGSHVILRDVSLVNQALHGFPHACLPVLNHSLYLVGYNFVQSLLML